MTRMPYAISLFFVAFLVLVGACWLDGENCDGEQGWPVGISVLGWSFGLGAVLWGYGLFLMNFVGLPLNRATICFLAVLLIASSKLINPLRKGILRLPSLFRQHYHFVSLTWFEWICVGLLFIGATTQYLFTRALPIYHWDALVVYASKANILFHAKTFRTFTFFDPGVVHPNDYPLLVPYLEASLYSILGGVDERAVKIVFYAYWLSFLSIIYGELRAKISRWNAIGFVSCLSTLPLFFRDFWTLAVSGYVDIPYAFYWIGSTLFLLQSESSGPDRMRRLSLVYLLGAAFLKPNGLWLAVLVSIALLYLEGENRRKSIIDCSLFWLFYAPWMWIRFYTAHSAGYYPTISSELFGRAVSRFGPLFGYLVREVLRFSDWGIFWLVIGASLGLGLSRHTLRKPAHYLLLLIVLQNCAYFLLYLISPLGLQELVEPSLARLFIHMSGLCTILAGWAWASTPLTRTRVLQSHMLVPETEKR